MQQLAKYGGSTLEANIQAASMRFRLITERSDKIRVKIRSMNTRDPFLGANYNVDDFSPFDSGLSESDVAVLSAGLIRNYKARATTSKLLGATSISTANVKSLVNFLRYDDPNKSVDEMLSERLTNGVSLSPRPGAISSVGRVYVPFKVEDGVISPAVDLSGYKLSLTQLDEFTRGRDLPSTFKPNSITVRVAPTQENFEAQYRAISPTDRNLSGTQGANFALRSDGSEATTRDLGSSMSDKSTVILLNHEVSQNQNSEFGEGNSIAETLAHEYGHSVHRSMGLNWGYSEIDNPNPLTAEYDSIFKQEISSYGSNNPREHFAESFAKYVYTGKTSPEFEKYLEETAKFGKFDLNSHIPEIFRGTNARSGFLSLNDKDLGGYTIKLTSFQNSLGSENEADLAQMARSAAQNGRIITGSASWSGNVYDQNGRSVGEFTRTMYREADGKMYIYHNLFRMAPSAQGDGFGTKFIDESFKLYKDWGLDRVEVTAGLDNGPYMWGLMGFDFKSETDRESKLAYARSYLSVLTKYNEKSQEYNSMTHEQVATDIFNRFIKSGESDSPQGSMNDRVSIMRIIQEARENGWNIDNNFIAEIEYLLSLPTSSATAQRIAELGRRNKKAGKKISSIGRIIMMKRGWGGRKYL